MSPLVAKGLRRRQSEGRGYCCGAAAIVEGRGSATPARLATQCQPNARALLPDICCPMAGALREPVALWSVLRAYVCFRRASRLQFASGWR